MDDIRKLQLLQKKTLKEVIRICNENNIKYYVMYGTLLGAVRHKGFIPWDDDLDIVMPRNDYVRFLACAAETLGEEFFLHTYDTDERYFVSFARVRLNNTTFIPEVYRDAHFKHNGVWIDIFPLDFAKSNNSLFERMRYISLQKALRPLSAVKVTGIHGNVRFKRKVLHAVSKIFSLKTLLKLIDMVSKAYKGKNPKYYVCFGSPYSMKKSYFPLAYFGEDTMGEFENMQCRIPSNYDGVLKILYGNYMQLPPEEARIGHLPTIFDLSSVEVEGE